MSKPYSGGIIRECPHYPCHPDIPEEEFSCQFCFCPLYYMDPCPGTPSFHVSDSGVMIKSCSGCNLPHHRKVYEFMITQTGEAMLCLSKQTHTDKEIVTE